MSLSAPLKRALSEAVSSPVLWDAPLAAWTSFRIGGPADALVTPADAAELRAVLDLCERQQTAWRLLGRGSNILAADAGFRGIIVVLGAGFKYIVRQPGPEAATIVVRAGAATSLSTCVDWCSRQGLAGLEFTAGIPGSLGGAVAMNAGAWGHEMADVVHRLSITAATGESECAREQLSFSYRRWDDQSGAHRSSVITAVEMCLQQSSSAQILETIKELRRRRAEKQPLGMPSAGSFFKNPPGTSAGRLIDASGLKGLRIGDAEVSEKHANFFVNRGRATAADVLALMQAVQDKVREEWGIMLEPEVQLL